MMKRNKYWTWFLFLSLVISACGTPAENESKPEVETPAITKTEGNHPDAKMVSQPLGVPQVDFAGLEHLLHFENDSAYVINFWATWCKPCVEELPYFEQLGEKYANEKFKVILISLDFPQQIEKKLLPFIEKNRLKSEVWVLDDPDANSWIDKVSPQWSGAIPATLVYNRKAREFREQSFESLEELEQLVKPFISPGG